MTGRWLRLHTPPRHVGRGAALGGLGSLNARGSWYYARSFERWKQRPETQELLAIGRAALAQGELGRIDGFRFIVTE